MRYANEFVFVLGLLAGTSRGRRLDFYQCNGCGRHTAQSSRGCDFQYDFAPVGEEDVGDVEPVEVHPGEAFEIDVDELLAGVSPSHFVSEEAHSFDWRSTGALYETVGVLRPTRSSVLSEPIDRILIYHELAHKDLEGGLLRSYVPAVPYGEEDGGSETVIQLSVNMEP
ncbi:MAG: hypothetical protein ABGY24_09625, partial [bacterium]